MKIGILGLQGDFAAHGRTLDRLHADWTLIRMPAQMDAVHGLIIPGGESTTLLKLMDQYGFVDRLRSFHADGGALFGTCAGLIVLAAEVSRPPQFSLGLIDVAVERNAYGRQRESFESEGTMTLNGRPEAIPMVFIRAPRIRDVRPGVMGVAHHGEEVVMVRQDRVLAATFHPELTDDTRVHRYFIEMTRTVSNLQGATA